MDNYYTPTIEELHTGFILEYRGKDYTTWNTLIFDSTAKDNNRLVNGELVLRVKYLDVHDIKNNTRFKHCLTKSLKGITERFVIEGYHGRIHESIGHMYWNLYLTYHPDTKVVKITADVSDGSQDEKFFEGQVNNINELQRILKHLNIK
jgi:hypothetical protein